MIGSSVDYARSGGMRNVPVTKAVEHLYATTAKFSGCVLLASRLAYFYPARRRPVLMQHEGYFGMVLMILNHGHMMRTIPEPSSLSKLKHYTGGRVLDPRRQIQRERGPHTRRTLGEMGFRTWNRLVTKLRSNHQPPR
ncbi:hypothetical protein AVEN_167873-1 [Araneus ventricosus]|uniref:Uncharacterized protein n=1 Tax=Araneus ventricosus TaxID=182803 RepID=A0A4Y2KMX6_ARAVE|nr:hypothetical protein AVEN_167873-1 [Araneus ventricosus]